MLLHGRSEGGARLADLPCFFFSVRFLYDGNRINDDDTPASLDMDDNGACFEIVRFDLSSEADGVFVCLQIRSM
jgi:hypothetical protein